MEARMSKSQTKLNENKISRKDRARATRVVGQFLAIRECLKDAGDKIDDIDEVAAQLTVAAFKPVK